MKGVKRMPRKKASLKLELKEKDAKGLIGKSEEWWRKAGLELGMMSL